MRAHFFASTISLFPWRACLLPGSSGENARGAVMTAGSGYSAELNSLDVCGLQPFRAGFHYKADSRAFS